MKGNRGRKKGPQQTDRSVFLHGQGAGVRGPASSERCFRYDLGTPGSLTRFSLLPSFSTRCHALLPCSFFCNTHSL